MLSLDGMMLSLVSIMNSIFFGCPENPREGEVPLGVS
jgi:hypothetical protein